MIYLKDLQFIFYDSKFIKYKHYKNYYIIFVLQKFLLKCHFH